jgi:hypothetical protein
MHFSHWDEMRSCVVCASYFFIYVVFYPVGEVQNFDSRLVLNRAPSKRRPEERDSCSDRNLYTLFPHGYHETKAHTHAVKVETFLVSR